MADVTLHRTLDTTESLGGTLCGRGPFPQASGPVHLHKASHGPCAHVRLCPVLNTPLEATHTINATHRNVGGELWSMLMSEKEMNSCWKMQFLTYLCYLIGHAIRLKKKSLVTWWGEALKRKGVFSLVLSPVCVCVFLK